MTFQKIHDQQAQMLKSIYSNANSFIPVKQEGILDLINSLSITDAEFALGNLGEKLKVFVDAIDVEHPDLSSIFDGQMSGMKEGTFSRESIDQIRLCLLAKKLNISHGLIQHTKKHIEVCKNYHKINALVDSPVENQLFNRLVSSEKVRNHIRSTKRFQNVSIPISVLEADCPEDLSDYGRFEKRFSKELQEAIKRKAMFEGRGLVYMANEIGKTIQELESQIDKTLYFGFNKISLGFASYVLAKMSGYQQDHYSYHTVLKIDTNKSSFLTNHSHFELSAKAYTSCELQKILPDSTKELIAHLDAFPDAGNKPIFDHFRFVVPSFSCSVFSSGPPYEFKDDNGNIFTFEEINDAQKNLDMFLLRSGRLISALLGERDGDHYLISYFFNEQEG